MPDVDDDGADVVRSSGLFGQGDELAYDVGGIVCGRRMGPAAKSPASRGLPEHTLGPQTTLAQDCHR